MIPRKYGQMLFSLLLSGSMSLLVSGITTMRAVGFSDGMPRIWVSAWLAAWIITFPAVMVVAPIARKAVELLISKR